MKRTKLDVTGSPTKSKDAKWEDTTQDPTKNKDPRGKESTGELQRAKKQSKKVHLETTLRAKTQLEKIHRVNETHAHLFISSHTFRTCPRAKLLRLLFPEACKRGQTCALFLYPLNVLGLFSSDGSIWLSLGPVMLAVWRVQIRTSGNCLLGKKTGHLMYKEELPGGEETGRGA